MIGMKLNTAKSMFFDSPKVKNAVDKATRKVLSRFGAFVRRTAKLSIRKRKKASEPGKPPNSHTGLLKKFIFFGYDPAKRSVVIGPTRLNSTAAFVPPILEHGGTTKIIKRRRGRRVVVPVQIAARPFMRPAFHKELPKLPDMWRDSVKP